MKKLLSLWIGICSFIVALAACAESEAPPKAAAIEEGTHYKLMSPALSTQDPNKIEVLEFFMHTCPHCYHFEPDIQAWLKKKPDDVIFNRIPAPFHEVAKLHAQTYCAAGVLDMQEKIHEELFIAIHQQNRSLDSVEAMTDFFVDQGVSADSFKSAFDSFAAANCFNNARIKVAQAQIQGVPAMLVNGKYLVSGGREYTGIKDVADILKVVDFLIEKERKTLDIKKEIPTQANKK